jgi:Uma2 family endonuclease
MTLALLPEEMPMSLQPVQVLCTEEDYLALERASEERHEYVDGQVYAMAGESPEHGTICTNLTMLIASQLRGTPCQAWAKDTKVRSGPPPRPRQPARGLFSYPDVVVVCGEPHFHDQYRDVLVNPMVLIEVLSPTTEAFDRGDKFFRYRTWLPSLTDYILVAQTTPLLDHFRRQPHGHWELSSAIGLGSSLSLDSIACTLLLTDVYERIAFPPEVLEAYPEEPPLA